MRRSCSDKNSAIFQFSQRNLTSGLLDSDCVASSLTMGKAPALTPGPSPEPEGLILEEIPAGEGFYTAKMG